jgi:DNA-binding MarR family transcriptional regulator
VTDLERLFSDLVRVETRLWNLLEARLQSELGLTLGRFETMAVLGRRGRCRAQDIAAELGITLSGTSKLLTRIEGAGHCVRAANPDDGRSSLIELTPHGRATLAEARGLVQTELAEHLDAALSPQAVRTLSATLARLKSSTYLTDATPGV